MNLFYLHPDDRRWLKRWFRNNLVCFACIIGFLLLLRLASMVPEAIGSLDAFGNRVDQDATVAVSPYGWRRTNEGWQHTSTWMRSSNHDVASSEPRPLPSMQPAWAIITMETVRRTSPLVIASIQITLIAIIIRISLRYQQTRASRLEESFARDS